MKLITPIILLIILSFSCVQAQTSGVAFINVNVVPMDRERILPKQTVIVKDGRIIATGPAEKIKVPKGTQRIDATGKYLMPGLADMHGHFAHRGPAQPYPLETFPLLLVAHGVTTVRNLSGYPAVLSLRQRINAGEMLGPQIFTTGPVLEGKAALTAELRPGSIVGTLAKTPSPVQIKFIETAGEAAEEVEREKREGYDAVKVYNLLPADAYHTVVQTAAKLGLPVYGHVPRSVRLSGALAARQRSIEHLHGYVEALQAAGSPFADSAFEPWQPRIVEHVDLTKLDALAKATRAAGAWNCPTLVLLPLATMSEQAARHRLQLPVMRYVAPARLRLWEDQIRNQNSRLWRAEDSILYARAHTLRLRIVKALHDAGVRLLAGTDFAASFVVPGYSLHEELQNLVAAGLTPYEALRAATADAAEFLNKQDEFGTVAAGRRADLLLLSANPLEDVRNAAKLEGVMVRGRWFTESELRVLLERQAASYANN